MPKSSQMEGRPVMRESWEPLMERMSGLWVAVGGDDAADLSGGAGEGVVGGADVVEGLAGVGDGEQREDADDGGDGEPVKVGFCGVAGAGLELQRLEKTMGTRRVRGIAMTR